MERAIRAGARPSRQEKRRTGLVSNCDNLQEDKRAYICCGVLPIEIEWRLQRNWRVRDKSRHTFIVLGGRVGLENEERVSEHARVRPRRRIPELSAIKTYHERVEDDNVPGIPRQLQRVSLAHVVAHKNGEDHITSTNSLHS